MNNTSLYFIANRGQNMYYRNPNAFYMKEVYVIFTAMSNTQIERFLESVLLLRPTVKKKVRIKNSKQLSFIP